MALRETLETLRASAEANATHVDATDRERAQWRSVVTTLDAALEMPGPERHDRLIAVIQRMQGAYGELRVRQIMRCWPLAGPEEQDARYRTIVKLVLELDRIRRQEIFASRLGDGVIKNIIDGDWEDAKRMASYFRFDEEHEELRAKFAPLWKTFVETVEAEALVAAQRARAVPEEKAN